jgi:dTDP-4-dehydrorhamnose 3,5-epimerase
VRFIETALSGAFVIELDPVEDERGFFARTFCVREFAAHGLETRIAQCNVSRTRRRGTLRGLHYQVEPATEAKLVRCVRGALFDVIVDVRPDSPTYLQHLGIELSADNGRALYVPAMCAHGFETLTDDVDVLYQISEFYAPLHARGVRYDDPALGIQWPTPVLHVSDKDTAWPLLEARNR